MPDFAGWTESLRLTLGAPLAAVAAVLLLLFGRRLYWLLAAVVGFAAAFAATQRFAPELGIDATVWLALGLGVLGAVAALLAHRVLLGLVGGLGGALVGLWQAQHLGIEQGWGWLVAALVGGLLGAWLLSRLFELALALLSSLLGAQLLVDRLPLPVNWVFPVYLALLAFGLYFQLLRPRRRKRRVRD